MSVLMEKTPRSGWTQIPCPPQARNGNTSAWTNGQATVISALVDAEAPDGSGEVIPQWHVSVSESGELARRAEEARGKDDLRTVAGLSPCRFEKVV